MKHKILLVDNRISMQKLMKMFLSEEGFKVKIASNGKEAMEAIKKQKPDIVVTEAIWPTKEYYKVKIITFNKETKKTKKRQRPNIDFDYATKTTKMDGYRFCKAIKSDPLLRNIPVIMLTAMGDKVKAKKAGVDGFLTKPFTLKLLLAKINTAISSKCEKGV